MTTTQNPGAALHTFIAGRLADGERVYAVVDAARDRDLAFAARDKFRLQIRSLFGERTVREMDPVAPYLVNMNVGSSYPYEGSGYLDLWAAKLGGSAGILLLTDCGAQETWLHLRQIFCVVDEDKHRFYFRFYDPRVLRLFLPACSPPDVREFFGPIRTMLVESENPRQILAYRPGHRGVLRSEHLLSTPTRVTAEAAR